MACLREKLSPVGRTHSTRLIKCDENIFSINKTRLSRTFSNKNFLAAAAGRFLLCLGRKLLGKCSLIQPMSLGIVLKLLCNAHCLFASFRDRDSFCAGLGPRDRRRQPRMRFPAPRAQQNRCDSLALAAWSISGRDRSAGSRICFPWRKFVFRGRAEARGTSS